MTLLNINAVPKHLQNLITPSDVSLTGANGSKLKIFGTLELNLSFVPYDTNYNIHAGIAEDVFETLLLGSDFLTKHSCILDFSQLRLLVSDVSVPLLKVTSSHQKCRTFDVKLTKTIPIPAKTAANKIHCSITAPKNSVKRCYISLSGLLRPA